MSIRAKVVKLIALLMRKAPLPTELPPVASTTRLTIAPSVSSLTDYKRVVIIVPGRGVIMQALAVAIASRLGHSKELVYGTGQANDLETWAWVDWNDSAALTRLTQASTTYVLYPVQIFERRGPASSNPRYRFGLMQSLEFLIFRRRSVILLGQPILIGASESISLSRLVRILKLERSRSLRLVRGVPFQSQRLQESQVLSGPEYDREVALLAQKNRISSEKARLLTRKEFRTISASPVRWIFAFSAFVARWIIRHLFSEVSILGMHQFVDASRDAAVVLVPMHRSHLDYILVGSVLYESKLNTPVVAAGLNLSFWPVGPIIRSLGAYFVRRNARNDRVHSLVLKRYVTYLTKRGHFQEFFIEGGRSRSGRMRTPKIGLLNIMVDACAKGLRKELLFIPVSISYENVVEERALADENTGASKQGESFSELIRIHRIFRRSYGEVVLQFGRPLSLSAMLARVTTNIAKPKPDTRMVVKELANALTTRLRSQSSVSLSGLVCTALLCAPRYGLSVIELEQRVVLLARLAKVARLRNAELGAPTKTLERFLQKPEALRSIAEARSGLFKIQTVVEDEVIFIPGAKRYLADFYRNSCHHVFFGIAVVCSAQRMSGICTREHIDRIYDVCEREFLLGTRDEFFQEIVGIMEVLASEGLATPASQQTQTGSDNILWTLAPEVMALRLDNLVLVSLESLLWVAEQLKSPSYETGAVLNYKDVVAKAQSEFRTAAYRTSGEPSRTEAGSQSNIAGGLEMLENLGLIEIQEGAKGPTAIIIGSAGKEGFNSGLIHYRTMAHAIRGTDLNARAGQPSRGGKTTLSH